MVVDAIHTSFSPFQVHSLRINTPDLEEAGAHALLAHLTRRRRSGMSDCIYLCIRIFSKRNSGPSRRLKYDNQNISANNSILTVPWKSLYTYLSYYDEK
jgi:hypothetical protein